jgi:hypothetical protein
MDRANGMRSYHGSQQLPYARLPSTAKTAVLGIRENPSYTGFKKIIFKQKALRGYLFES